MHTHKPSWSWRCYDLDRQHSVWRVACTATLQTEVKRNIPVCVCVCYGVLLGRITNYWFEDIYMVPGNRAKGSRHPMRFVHLPDFLFCFGDAVVVPTQGLTRVSKPWISAVRVVLWQKLSISTYTDLSERSAPWISHYFTHRAGRVIRSTWAET